MERVYSPDDRIRRAEEIYARRQRLRENTKRATLNVSEPKNYKLLKKLVLQIIICILIYFVFHLVNTTSYSFSDETINKTKELISYDYDFYSVYNIILENINSFLYSDENNQENNENDKASEEKKEDIENQENNQQEENKEDEKNVENQENINNEESVNQSEVSHTEESEAERIKNNYAFTLPLSRNNIIRIWR